METFMGHLNELTYSQIAAVVGLIVTIIAGIVFVFSAKSVWNKQEEIDLTRGE
jgi:hypothetical protein